MWCKMQILNFEPIFKNIFCWRICFSKKRKHCKHYKFLSYYVDLQQIKNVYDFENTKINRKHAAKVCKQNFKIVNKGGFEGASKP